MNMIYLKEDGSLDIERINSLPPKEFVDAIVSFTNEQQDEYISKVSINECNKSVHPLVVDDLDEFIARNGVVITDELLDELKNNRR